MISIEARNEDVILAGSRWLPTDTTCALLIMHTGSGPADRDNDVLFPPIRDQLLANGIAVASFDKRGGGESTGRWSEADIPTQATDLAALVTAVQDQPSP